MLAFVDKNSVQQLGRFKKQRISKILSKKKKKGRRIGIKPFLTSPHDSTHDLWKLRGISNGKKS